MTKREYDKLINDLKGKLKKGQMTNKEEAYNEGILCAMSKIKQVYVYNNDDITK